MRMKAIALLVVTVAVSGLVSAGGGAASEAPGKEKPAAAPAPKEKPAAPPTAAAKGKPETVPAPKEKSATPPPQPAKPAPPAPPPPAPAPVPPTKEKPAPPPGPKLVAIQVEPAKFVLKGKWASQTLLVMGRISDGSVRDLSSAAEFKSANPGIADAAKEGVVRPVADGETTISIVAKLGDSTQAAQVPVVVKDAKDDSAAFASDVMPLLSRLGCNQSSCHGSAKGKNGLKLSMFGAEPDADYAAVTKSAYGRRINRVEPQKSLLLVKPTAQIPHGGGQRIAPGSADYDLLASWVAQGAPWGDEKGPKLVGLKVFPEEPVLQNGETQQLLVAAVYSDGTQKDVTRRALYKSADPKVAEADASGKLKAAEFGESAVLVTYVRRSAIARTVVPQPLPTPFPPLQANNKIDELVYARWKKLGIPPSELCSDQEFVRRAYLDVIGTLPTADESRAFLADKDPAKRSKLIDRLLERDEYADYWSLKWGDLLRIKSEYPVNVWPKAVQVYYRWVHDSLVQNKPYDQFARELLTSNGSNFRRGPANYLRAVQNKDPQTFGETTALVFMGARIGCARCHGHPSEDWTAEDDLGLAAFFAKVSFKSTLEWKEEIVYFNPKAGLWHPKTRQLVKPRFLGGEAIELPPEEDPRVKFADWLVSPQNPWFAKNIVNRIWFWLLGRGIVHEPDDLRPTNPPENTELLEFLEKELVGSKYNLKHVFRLILNSRTYQLSSKTSPWNEKDLAHFSHYPVRRLSAEQLLDAICQATETSDSYASWIPVPPTILPAGSKAAQISDGDIDSVFLQLFGRPARDTCYEGERNAETSLRQALHLMASGHVEGKVANSPRIQRLFQAKKSDAEVVDEVYLATLSRFPTPEQKGKVIDYLAKNKNARAQAVQDLVWAILNTKEFFSNH